MIKYNNQNNRLKLLKALLIKIIPNKNLKKLMKFKLMKIKFLNMKQKNNNC